MRFLAILLIMLAAALPSHAQDGVREAATAELAARFPHDAERLRVRVLRTGGLRDGALDAPRVVLTAADALPRGRTQVRIETGDGQTGWALLHVAHFDSVVVARADVARGEAVSQHDLTVAWMETTRFHGEPLRAADLKALRIDGTLFAERALREGRALRRDDLRLPYAADTGEAVEMRYRRGRLIFRLTGRAREPGHVGEVIRLYSDDTDTMYRARLDAPGHATWIETL